MEGDMTSAVTIASGVFIGGGLLGVIWLGIVLLDQELRKPRHLRGIRGGLGMALLLAAFFPTALILAKGLADGG